MNEVTKILSAIDAGDPHAADHLLPLVYDELRKLAAQRLAQEKPGQTLQATALVHEAYVRLVGTDGTQQWNSRGHFFAAAAEAMRRILVERARREISRKRGVGERIEINLDKAEGLTGTPPEELLALNEALDRLSTHDSLSGDLIKLHYFAGISMDDVAVALGLSRATAYRQLTFARAWLRAQVAGDELSSRAE
jgi:RNA polymerase sigma factor (TIGR02999 family)